MKVKFFLSSIMLMPLSAYACGGNSSNFFDITLLLCVFAIFFCAIALPAAGLLYSANCSKKLVFNVVLGSVLTGALSLWAAINGSGREEQALGILGVCLSLAVPTGFYLYKAIKFKSQ